MAMPRCSADRKSMPQTCDGRRPPVQPLRERPARALEFLHSGAHGGTLLRILLVTLSFSSVKGMSFEHKCPTFVGQCVHVSFVFINIPASFVFFDIFYVDAPGAIMRRPSPGEG
jgi:hypothetical protein